MPSTDDNECRELVDRIKANESEAWTVLDGRFRERLLELVRQHLPAEIQARVDEDDIVQEVFLSLIGRVKRDHFECDSEEHLLPIVSCLAMKRLCDEIRRHHRNRRSTSRERGCDWTAPTADVNVKRIQEPLDHQPGPDRVVDAHDALGAFIEKLHPRLQIVMHLLVAGDTFQEIADATKWSPRTVQDLWSDIRTRARELRMDEWMD